MIFTLIGVEDLMPVADCCALGEHCASWVKEGRVWHATRCLNHGTDVTVDTSNLPPTEMLESEDLEAAMNTAFEVQDLRLERRLLPSGKKFREAYP